MLGIDTIKTPDRIVFRLEGDLAHATKLAELHGCEAVVTDPPPTIRTISQALDMPLLFTDGHDRREAS